MGLAQARRWTQPLPVQSPTAPTLRANPYPEVTDPICRLPLPTLFYRPEAVNLGDLLRIWVRAGAKSPSPTPKFSRSHRPLVDAARTAALFAKTKTRSPCETIPGPRWLMQKRQLSPELRWPSPSHVALPRRITRYPNGSTAWHGNKDQFPFRLNCGFSDMKKAARLIKVSPKP